MKVTKIGQKGNITLVNDEEYICTSEQREYISKNKLFELNITTEPYTLTIQEATTSTDEEGNEIEVEAITQEVQKIVSVSVVESEEYLAVQEKKQAREQVKNAGIEELLALPDEVTKKADIHGKELGDLLVDKMLGGNPHKEQQMQREYMENLLQLILGLYQHLELPLPELGEDKNQKNEIVKQLLSKF